jgi:hypothetical protein
MSKEKVHDSEISPLIDQIIAICKTNNNAMIASFSLDDELMCTSALLKKETNPPENYFKALNVIRYE